MPTQNKKNRSRCLKSFGNLTKEITHTAFWSSSNGLHTSQVAYKAGGYPGFLCMKRLRVFLFHYSPVPIYTPGWRGTVRVKCLAQEHNTISPARARTQTARSRVERTNYETIAPPTRVTLSIIL